MTKQGLPFKSVGMLVISDYWYWQMQMCRDLKARGDVRITLYVASSANVKFVQQTLEEEFYDDVVVRNFQALPYEETIDEATVLAEARKWEEYLGVYYTDLIMTNRNFGRGYALGGFYHARSFASEMNDHSRIISLYTQELEFWNNEFESKKIDLFVNPFKFQFVMCRKFNVPGRLLYGSHYGAYHYWAKDEFALNEDFEKKFELVKNDALEPIKLEKGNKADSDFRHDFFKRYGPVPFVKNTIKRVIRRTIAHIKQDESRRGAYVISNTIRHWRTYTEGRKLISGKLITPLEEFQDKKYVYFPLQTEPEWTLQGQSPEFFCQLWAVALAAKAMPCDTTLVVKEHIYPIGARPKNFYEQIVEFKNIKLASAAVLGTKIIENCKAVISINGSSGYEAAIQGIPAIILSDRCDFAFLDHVFHCPKGEGLREAVAKICDEKVDLNKAKLDGARFVKAIKLGSFSTGNYSMRKREIVEASDVKVAVDALLETIPEVAKAAA